MKVKFKYNVGDTVTLLKRPSHENMQYGKYIYDNEFTPNEYRIEKCKCKMIGTEEPKILYNLYAYCDEYIQFHNWIPESDLSGPTNEHEEDVTFISHDKEILSIGDVVAASIFYGDYEDSYLSPSLTFAYVGTIFGFEYEIIRGSSLIRRTALVDRDGKNEVEFTPYLVKNFDETFVLEYVKFCKKDRFNPIKEADRPYAKHKVFLEGVHLWDKVIETYNNWNKVRQGAKKKNYKPNKKLPKVDPLQSDIKKLLKSLTEEQKEELKKQLIEEQNGK
jgi:hypothetical protein